MKHWNKWIAASALIGLCVQASAADWPVWGRNHNRNLYSPEKGIPLDFDPGRFVRGSEQVDLSTTENIKWVAKLGSQAYGNTTISNGKVFIGTNNESPRNPDRTGDRGIVYCLDEATGKFLWQLTVPKLGAGKVSDWEFLGICSSPAVDGDRVYLISNRCEVICLDINGLADGNDGDFQDEGAYIAGPGAAPIEPTATDADIIWVFDMREELGVFPHNIASSSVLITEDRIYATTSNGQDWSHLNIPSPFAPCLVALDKKTGELIAEEGSGISQNLKHCNWSSPSMGEVNGKNLIFFGAGDGICYAFETQPKEDEDGYMILQEHWKFDCVPQKYKVDADGEPIKYPAADGPSEIIATPVFYKNKIYVAIGQDPEHGEGVGLLTCIDATKSGDITKDGAIWQFDKIMRTISTVAIDPTNDLLFASDYSGFVYCLNALTGEHYWTHDLKAHLWSSPLVVDGKVYVGDEDGDLVILASDKEEKILKEILFDAPIYSTPVVANGSLYIGTQTHLYVVAAKEKGTTTASAGGE